MYRQHTKQKKNKCANSSAGDRTNTLAIRPNTGSSVFNQLTKSVLYVGMKGDDRIKELCSQLLRAENWAVLQTVAAELHQAIDEYLETRRSSAALDYPPPTGT